MTPSLVPALALGLCAVVALVASVYLAVRPRRTSTPTRVGPVAWHLVRSALTAVCATTAAVCVLLVVVVQGG